MIKLITFDLDNTLWEVVPPIIAAEKTMRAWLQERVGNYNERVTGEFMTALREDALRTNPQLRYNISDMRILLLTQALHHCDVPDIEAATLAKDAFAVFMQGRNAVDFYPGALQTIAQLAKRYRLAALTNGNADISVMPIAQYFEFSIAPEMVQARKPEPKIFTETLARADCKAHEVIHVGDNLEEDIGGAANAGWQTVWANIGGEPVPAAPNYTACISHLSELPAVINQIDQGG